MDKINMNEEDKKVWFKDCFIQDKRKGKDLTYQILNKKEVV